MWLLLSLRTLHEYSLIVIFGHSWTVNTLHECSFILIFSHSWIVNPLHESYIDLQLLIDRFALPELEYWHEAMTEP